MKTRSILEHLEKFMAIEAVAQHGSIRKASGALNISQPSLSVKIKTLEDVLELKLMERTRNGIHLTRAGEKAVVFAKSVAQNAEDLRVELERTQDTLEGHVQIGIYDSIARYLWPQFYKSFSQKYPTIKMTVSTGRSQWICEQLLDGSIDLGLVAGHSSPKGLVHLPLYEDTFSGYCTPAFAKSLTGKAVRGSSVKIRQQLQKIPLIYFSQAIGKSENSLVDENTISQYHIHPVENFEIARAFCLESIGLAILPNHVAKEDFEKKRLIKACLSKDQPLNFNHHSIDLVAKKAIFNRPIMETVIQEIQKFV